MCLFPERAAATLENSEEYRKACCAAKNTQGINKSTPPDEKRSDSNRYFQGMIFANISPLRDCTGDNVLQRGILVA
jgi:hypothetical protein